MKITNAFSLNMVSDNLNIVREKINPDDVSGYCYRGSFAGAGRYEIESCIGHADTANIISRQIGIAVEMNRCSIQLKRGEKFILAQYSGPRLPEGCTELPEGATIDYYYCRVIDINKLFKAWERLQDIMQFGDGCIETAHYCLTGERKKFSEEELFNMYEWGFFRDRFSVPIFYILFILRRGFYYGNYN